MLSVWMKGQTGREILHFYSTQKPETWRNINAVTALLITGNENIPPVVPQRMLFSVTVWWVPGVLVPSQYINRSFTAISPHHFVLLMNKILKRCLFSEAGSGEVLCWHLGCLFTSHSRPLRGCFWLSATIWNANGFLSAQLSKFFCFLFPLPLCKFLLPAGFVSLLAFLTTSHHLSMSSCLFGSMEIAVWCNIYVDARPLVQGLFLSLVRLFYCFFT